MNRTILETARTILLYSILLRNKGNEAVLTAQYLINRRPNITRNLTATELLYQEKLKTMKKLKIFGCATYLHIPKELREKFDSKTRKTFFVEYTSNGYRF